MNNMKWLCAVLLLLLCNISSAEDNVHFSGVLVSSPCTLPDADTDIQLDFGSLIVKSLYQYQRSASKPFVIHLQDCNSTVMNTVSVTFQGMQDNELTDLLALDAGSTAQGIAIGIELANKTPLTVNKPSPEIAFYSGNNTLNFNAFVQIKPTALANRTLVVGSFSAVSTFILNYQ